VVVVVVVVYFYQTGGFESLATWQSRENTMTTVSIATI
jgi:hypothetical protein